MDNATKLLMKGMDRIENNDINGASAFFDKAIKANPYLPSAYFLKGRAEHVRGNIKDAIRYYDAALTLDPTAACVYEYRGAIKLSLKDYESAKKDTDAAIRLREEETEKDFSGLASLYFKKSACEFNLDDFEAALADLNEAIRLDPTVSLHYRARAIVKDALYDYKGAEKDNREAKYVEEESYSTGKDDPPYIAKPE